MGYVFDAPTPKEDEIVEETVTITISVFFDGTQNNMKNTEARLEYLKKEEFERTPMFVPADFTKQQWDKLRWEHYDVTKAEYYRKSSNKDDDSYMNDYSNVARLFKYYEEEGGNKEDLRAAIYIEGIATSDYESDQVFPALVFGQSGLIRQLGVLDKVKKGGIEIKKKLGDLNRRNKRIKKLTIDVFGFSRGAAAARNFLYEITKPAKAAYTTTVSTPYGPQFINIPAQPAFGYIGDYLEESSVDCDEYVIRFAGLFDTVSSYGLKKSDDVKELNLNAVSKARYALHLTAADEHRVNFPLITIQSALNNPPEDGVPRAMEIALPGVHSDVGGCYVDWMNEVKDELMNGTEDELQNEKRRLISDGWYKEPQLKIGWFNPKSLATTAWNVLTENYSVSRKLTGTREYLSNRYSFIPLYIMCEYAMKKPIFMKFLFEKLKNEYKIPCREVMFKDGKKLEKDHSHLLKINQIIHDFVFDKGKPLKFYTRKELETKINSIKSKNNSTSSSQDLNNANIIIKKDDVNYVIPQRWYQFELNPEEYNSFPELKQQIEDHILLKKIRNEYLHWSSNHDWVGMDPNYDKATKDRKRVPYQG